MEKRPPYGGLFLTRFIIPFFLRLLDHIFLKGFHNRRVIDIFEHCHIEVSLPARRDEWEDFYIQGLQDRDIWCDADAEPVGDESCGDLIFVNLIGDIR